MTLRDRYLDLAQLQEYSAISARKLRSLIRDPIDPMPCYRVGGRYLVKRSEFDEWMQRFRVPVEVNLDGLVSELTGEV